MARRAPSPRSSCCLWSAAGCGGQATPEVAAGAWVHQGWGLERGPDSAIVVTSSDGELVALTTNDDGVVTSAAVTEDGVQDGRPLSTGMTYARLGGAAAFADGYVAVGSGGLLDRPGYDDELTFEALVLSSSDGLRWRRTPATGLEGPMEFSALLTGNDGLVAVGSRRTARDPSFGGFRGAIWHSTDGVRWHEADLPTSGRTSYVGGVTAVGDALLAVGEDAGRGAAWRSDDGGLTWSSVDLAVEGAEVPGSLTEVAVQGETVVLSTSGSPDLLVSIDGGATWREPRTPPPDGEGYGRLDVAGGRWWTWVSDVGSHGGGEPALAECYAAPNRCGADRGGLYVSDDGATWERVGDDGLRVGALDSGPAATAPDGGVALVDGRGVSLLAAGDVVATSDEPTPPRADITEVPASGPEVGVRYAVPLFVHCGSEWLFLGDSEEVWRRTDRRGDVPSSWPLPNGAQVVYGYATLTSDTELEYAAADGTVLATYEPSEVPAPGCD